MSRTVPDGPAARGPAPAEAGPGARVPLRRLLVFFATVYAVQGLAEPKAGLATQPLFFLLKDEMRLSAAETATFLALIGFAWNVKPLYGLTSDLIPFLGYRRRSYLLVTTAMAALGWLALGLLPAYPWGPTLAILGLTGLGLAFTDVLCDAVMVEEGKARGLTARFQSIQWTAIYGASLVAGVTGGYLSAHVSYSRTFLLVALFPALSFAASAWAVHEPRTRVDRATVKETLAALREGARWVPSGGPRRSFFSGTSRRRSGCRSSTTWWTSSGSPRSSLACCRVSGAAPRCSARSCSGATRRGSRRSPS